MFLKSHACVWICLSCLSTFEVGEWWKSLPLNFRCYNVRVRKEKAKNIWSAEKPDEGAKQRTQDRKDKWTLWEGALLN